jgi:hypothetical protein
VSGFVIAVVTPSAGEAFFFLVAQHRELTDLLHIPRQRDVGCHGGHIGGHWVESPSFFPAFRIESLVPLNRKLFMPKNHTEFSAACIITKRVDPLKGGNTQEIITQC